MVYYILKVLLSSVIIVLISEISKRSSVAGSILASLPLMSLLAFIWMYIDTKDIQKISSLSSGIFWMVIPSLLLFILLPILLKKQVSFWWALGISTSIMVLFYFVMIFVLKKFGIKL
jgi:hypothetical protein